MWSLLIFWCLCSWSHGQFMGLVRGTAPFTNKEIDRLFAYSQRQPTKTEAIETKDGDVVVTIQNVGTTVYSRDSEFVAPIRAGRELLALVKKYGEYTLIPFAELSEVTRQELRKQVIEQLPEHDITEKSCFTAQVMMEESVIVGWVPVNAVFAPSKFTGLPGSDPERDKFLAKFASAPLTIARSKEEGERLRSTPWPRRETVEFLAGMSTNAKLILESKSDEVFRVWFSNELNNLSKEIEASFVSGPRWQPFLAAKQAKSSEELGQVSPTLFENLRSRIDQSWKMMGFPSQTASMDALKTASISHHFKISIRSAVEKRSGAFNFVLPD